MKSTFEKMTKSTRQYWKNNTQVILTLWLQDDKTVDCRSEMDGSQGSKHDQVTPKETRQLFQPRIVV